MSTCCVVVPFETLKLVLEALEREPRFRLQWTEDDARIRARARVALNDVLRMEAERRKAARALVAVDLGDQERASS